MRLNKYISESGVCSRREADQWIEQGRVQINGRRAKLGDQVAAADTVLVDGQRVRVKEPDRFVFLAVNKPVGVTCTTEAGVRNNIVDLVGHQERIFHIGRLDKDSQGLIFMTNDGDIVNKILRAGNQHEKEYVVTVDKPLTDAFTERMSKGVPILGVVTKKCKVERISTFVFRIVLMQGLNRQIRRMCDYLGFEVLKLERVRIMNITLKGIPLGQWRDLTRGEMGELLSAIAQSSSTEEASTSNKLKDGIKQHTPASTRASGAGSAQRLTSKNSSKAPARSKLNVKRPVGGTNRTGTAQPTKPTGRKR